MSRIIKTVLWAGLSGLWMGFAQPVWARPPSPINNAAPQPPLAPLAMNTLARGATVQSQGVVYQVLPELRAVAPGVDGAAGALAPFGRTPADVVARPANFQVFRQAVAGPMPMGAQVQQTQGQPSFPVAMNARTGALAVMPGTLMVHLASMNDAQAVAQAHALTVKDTFAHLGFAVMAVAPGGDVTVAQTQLAADGRVTQVNIEFIERTPKPQ